MKDISFKGYVFHNWLSSHFAVWLCYKAFCRRIMFLELEFKTGLQTYQPSCQVASTYRYRFMKRKWTMRENPGLFWYCLQVVRVMYLLYVNKYVCIHLHIHTNSNSETTSVYIP